MDVRLAQHQEGEGANYTKKRRPIKLLITEEYDRIDEAFFKEKQIKNWSRKKKLALINGTFEELNALARCLNKTHYSNRK
jgi:putative endonuclease